MKEDFPSLVIYPVIADIRDLDRLSVIFEDIDRLVVFHTAAHKHVPLMEVNVEEAVTNNVLGTRNVVEVSANYEVEQLVMISTDKAIRPTSVYGATKAAGGADRPGCCAKHRAGLFRCPLWQCPWE